MNWNPTEDCFLTTYHSSFTVTGGCWFNVAKPSHSGMCEQGHSFNKCVDYNNPAVRTVLTWQRVQLTPTRQRSTLKSGPHWYDLTFKGKTYHHQSGRDLRVKTRVWTFSPQINEFGGRSAYYFNAAPIFCALWSPDLDLCLRLCLKPFLSCHTTGALVSWWTWF